MSTILEAVGDYLQTNGYGTQGTDIFLAVMPESPDACISVYENVGNSPQFTMGSDPWAIDRPVIQVICRAARSDYPTARNEAEAIRALLGAVTNTTISGIPILRIESQGSVVPMGEDENQRPMVSVNFECMVRYE
jgi:hypothetical protein